MLFNSLDYFVFLGLALVGYWTLRRSGIERDIPTPAVPQPKAGRSEREQLAEGAHPYRGGSSVALRVERTAWRHLFVFLASCVFYMAWNPAYIALILVSTISDFLIGLALGRTDDRARRKALVLASLFINLGLLGTFKYFDFFSSATQDVFGVFGTSVITPRLELVLPVGISFYTFQTLSYTVDVYRRRIAPCTDPIKFAFYVTFFPQLVAGPIVRAAEFLPQLERPPWLTRERVGNALF